MGSLRHEAIWAATSSSVWRLRDFSVSTSIHFSRVSGDGLSSTGCRAAQPCLTKPAAKSRSRSYWRSAAVRYTARYASRSRWADLRCSDVRSGWLQRRFNSFSVSPSLTARVILRLEDAMLAIRDLLRRGQGRPQPIEIVTMLLNQRRKNALAGTGHWQIVVRTLCRFEICDGNAVKLIAMKADHEHSNFGEFRLTRESRRHP